MNLSFASLIVGASLVVACDAPRITPDTQGVSVAAGPCGRGLLVVESDYQSSNVSALSLDGSVLSRSLASSSTESSGFGVTLSGDAVLPSSLQDGPRVALIDRYPTGVLRFVELASARVVSELALGTGFAANPQDYLALSAGKAYVPRYERNPNPGRQAWDRGGDILIVDPSVPALTGRIDLDSALAGEPAQFSPHPGQLLQVDGRVFAVLASYADDYRSATTSRLVEIDPTRDELVFSLKLDGSQRCSALAVSPDHTELAIACTGDGLQSAQPELSGSGLVLVDISVQPRVRKRLAASALGSQPLSFSLAYAAPDTLLFGTFGHFEASGAVGALDAVLRLDTASEHTTEVLRAESEPFTLGAVHCAAACGACFVADAKRAGGSVLRFPVDAAGVLGTPAAIRVEQRIGLPPRYLGAF